MLRVVMMSVVSDMLGLLRCAFACRFDFFERFEILSARGGPLAYDQIREREHGCFLSSELAKDAAWSA